MPQITQDYTERRDAIRSILVQGSVRNQDELQRQLAKKGYRVTQSSVSRDLRELHVIKVDGCYTLAPTPQIPLLPSSNTLEYPALSEAAWIQRISPAGNNLLVVQLPPGRAATLAVAIDQRRWPEIVGSIAGDDTLFIAVRNRRSLISIQQKLEQARQSSSGSAFLPKNKPTINKEN